MKWYHGLIVAAVIIGVLIGATALGAQQNAIVDRCANIPSTDYTSASLWYNSAVMILTINGQGSQLPTTPFFLSAPDYSTFKSNYITESQNFPVAPPPSTNPPTAPYSFRGEISSGGTPSYPTTIAYHDALFWLDRNYVTVYPCQVVPTYTTEN